MNFRIIRHQFHNFMFFNKIIVRNHAYSNAEAETENKNIKRSLIVNTTSPVACFA